MPLPLFAVAIPIVHSSGAWIASTAASGYIAGTISSTWIGAFVLGNSSLLGSLGLVSAAGVFGASGGLAGLAALSSSTAFGIGTALSAVGLGGVAKSLGLIPAATFLGLTAAGWMIAGTTATVAVTVAGLLGYYFTRKTMKRLNEERVKGGLEPTTFWRLIKEVRLLERRSLQAILARLGEELGSVALSIDKKDFTVDGQVFSIRRLKYVVNKDGSEEVVFVTKVGRKKRILLVKSASGLEGQVT